MTTNTDTVEATTCCGGASAAPSAPKFIELVETEAVGCCGGAVAEAPEGKENLLTQGGCCGG